VQRGDEHDAAQAYPLGAGGRIAHRRQRAEERHHAERLLQCPECEEIARWGEDLNEGWRPETRQRYEDERLYCVACREQPDYFEEITNWQRSHVTPRGELIDVKGGDVGYQCPTCGGLAEWGSELNAGD
jgi:hypothetical protein